MNSKRLLKKAASPQESFKENLPCYIMIAPFILLFILFLIIPIVASVVLSLFDFDMVSAPRFIGFTNYFRMFFDDEVFVTIVKNTLVLALITGPVGFALSFVLAWFLNEFKPFMRTLLSFMFYCPALVGNAYFIWQVAFSSDSYGYDNVDPEFSFHYGRIIVFLVKVLVAIIVIVVILAVIGSLSRGSGSRTGGYPGHRRPGSGGTVFIPPSTGRRRNPMSGSRPSAARRSSSGSSHSSFGGTSLSSFGSGHGGGGRSRGGGAGRRGR